MTFPTLQKGSEGRKVVLVTSGVNGSDYPESIYNLLLKFSFFTACKLRS